MIDITQLLLTLVILVVTALLVILGVQVYYILREFRVTLQKANKVLDDTGVISESVSKPVSFLSTMLLGIKSGSRLLQVVSGGKKGVKKQHG